MIVVPLSQNDDISNQTLAPHLASALAHQSLRVTLIGGDTPSLIRGWFGQHATEDMWSRFAPIKIVRGTHYRDAPKIAHGSDGVIVDRSSDITAHPAIGTTVAPRRRIGGAAARRRIAAAEPPHSLSPDAFTIDARGAHE
jgi:hypothetical protein